MWAIARWAKDTGVADDALEILHNQSEEAIKWLKQKLACDKANKQTDENCQYIVIGHSWGTGSVEKITKDMWNDCGIVPVLAVYVDGVERSPLKGPGLARSRPPLGRTLLNYYQTEKLPHGGPVDGMTNVDFTAEYREYAAQQKQAGLEAPHPHGWVADKAEPFIKANIALYGQ